MPLTMHRASVAVFETRLRALRSFLALSERLARENGVDPVSLIGARLAPDMLPLAGQVQIATDHAKGAACRLAARDIPRFADEEASFEDLDARILRTLDLLATVQPGDLDGSETRQITLKLGGREMSMTGEAYLFDFALPNFHFHVTTAYAILRNQGLALGKLDFMGVARQ